MAQRTVAISARYLTCLSLTPGVNFFRSGSASSQRPFDASSMPRSIRVAFSAGWEEAAGDELAGACAKAGAVRRARQISARKPKKETLAEIPVLSSKYAGLNILGLPSGSILLHCGFRSSGPPSLASIYASLQKQKREAVNLDTCFVSTVDSFP